MFERIFDFFYRHAKLTLVLSALLLAAAAFSVRHLPVELDLYEREVTGFPSTRDYQETRARFKDSNSVIFFFSAGRGLIQGELCTIKDWLQKEQSRNPEIQGIASPFSLRNAEVKDDRVWYFPYLKLDCENNAAKANKAFDLSPLLKTPWRQILTDNDGQDLGVEFLFRDTPGGSRFGRFDPKPIRELYSDAQTELSKEIPGLQIYMVGPSAFHMHLREALVHDFALQGVIFVLFLFAFRYAFGTWRSGFIYFGSLVVNLLVIYGTMAAVGQPLDILTNNLTLMTAIAGAEDFLFVAMMMRLQRCGWHEAMRKMAAPCFFTTLTTFIGFVSLKTSDVDIVGRFGVWAGWATFAEWVVLFLIFPAVFKYVPVLGKWTDPERAANLGWIRKLAKLQASKVALALSLVLFIGGFVGLNHLNINEDPTRNFPASHIATRSFDYLEKSRGWRGAVSIVFESDSIVEKKGEIERVTRQIESDPNVVAIVTPFSATEFVSQKLPPDLKGIVENDIKSTPLHRRVFSADDQARSIVYLKNVDLESLKTFSTSVSRICPEGFCRVVGQSAVYMEFSEKIVPTLISSFTASIALVIAILVMLAVWLGIPNRIAVCFSAVWGPVAMMGLIAALQIPVNLITSLFAAVIVGLTGDNAIQYLFAAKGGNLHEGLKERGEASVFLGLLLAASSAVFLLQTVKPMKMLGVLFFIGFIVNLAGDLWLLKGLLPAESKDEIKK